VPAVGTPSVAVDEVVSVLVVAEVVASPGVVVSPEVPASGSVVVSAPVGAAPPFTAAPSFGVVSDGSSESADVLEEGEDSIVLDVDSGLDDDVETSALLLSVAGSSLDWALATASVTEGSRPTTRMRQMSVPSRRNRCRWGEEGVDIELRRLATDIGKPAGSTNPLRM